MERDGEKSDGDGGGMDVHRVSRERLIVNSFKSIPREVAAGSENDNSPNNKRESSVSSISR